MIRWTDSDYFDIKLFVSTSLIVSTLNRQDLNKKSHETRKFSEKTDENPFLITPPPPQDVLWSQEEINS